VSDPPQLDNVASRINTQAEETVRNPTTVSEAQTRRQPDIRTDPPGVSRMCSS
jgi:hypothetical protein